MFQISLKFSCLALAWLGLCAFGPWRPAGAGGASLGMADAQVAAGAGAGALYGNPAGMSQVQHGVIEAGFARAGHAASGAPFVSYVDSTSAWGLAAGVGYAKEMGWTASAPVRDGHDLRLGLSVGGQSDAGKLLLGGTARYLAANRGSEAAVSGWTGDIGAIVGMQVFRIGAVLRNVAQLDARIAPRRVGLAVGFIGQQLVGEAGASLGAGNGESLPADSATGPSYRAGLTFQFGQEGLQLRTGYQFDQIVANLPTRHWVCGGLAWRTPKMGFDLSMAVDAVGNHSTMIAASLTFLVPYDAESP
ncbi:MAG: hypothetical protein EXR77_02825 [Myxococcales bacterium]|nr:hypothetical protein [Myxococcales bacterium]